MKTFLAALSFFTRIPVKKQLKTSHFSQATGMLPLIGYIVGAVWGFSTLILSDYINSDFSIIASIFSAVLLTGALHEDGFADCCDGFGGGYTKERILSIMKDSSTGVYGAIGLIFIFLSRYTLISSLNITYIAEYLVAVSVISRIAPVIITSVLEYSTTDKSKSRYVSDKLPLKLRFFSFLSVVPLILILDFRLVSLLLASVICLSFIFSLYIKKRIQGFTGDTLGASIILSEILSFLLISVYSGKL